MTRHRRLRPMLRDLLVLSLVGWATLAPAQERRYRILVSNDDGVGSEGIAAMVAELSAFADVVVVAPAENQSGSSHQTIMRTRISTVTPFEREGELFGYAVDATPADAVRFGLLLHGRERPFDLVVSGINDGANVGMIAHMSGTVGAAMEAMLNGVPAVAVSQGNRGEFTTTARFTADFVRELLERGADPTVLLSINVPPGELLGVRAAPMGGFYFRVSGVEEVESSPEGTRYRAITSGAWNVEPGSDTELYLARYVTVTPLRIDWTDPSTLRELEGWDLRLEPEPR